jgi:LEA14-like dessication related protein
MKIFRIGSCFFALVLLAGCASTSSKLQAPHLTVVGASTTSADIFSQQFRVRVHVGNPNDRALPIKSIDYKLFLEGDSFAEGASTASFVVPAHGEKEFDLTMSTNFISSIARLLTRINDSANNTIEYTFTGTVVIDAMFSPKLKFAENGTVQLGRKKN